MILKVTHKEMTNNGLETKYLKTTFDQVVDENNVTLEQILTELQNKRDFNVNPIDLTNEVTNILPQSNLQSPSTTDISFTDSDNNITSDKLHNAILELYNLASQGKQLGVVIGFDENDSYVDMKVLYELLFNDIKTVLSSKGIDVSLVTKLDEVANKIDEIEDGVNYQGFNTLTEEVTTIPHVKEIPLVNVSGVNNIVTSLTELDSIANERVLANPSNFTWEYDEENNKIIYTINKLGIYTYNWID